LRWQALSLATHALMKALAMFLHAGVLQLAASGQLSSHWLAVSSHRGSAETGVAAPKLPIEASVTAAAKTIEILPVFICKTPLQVGGMQPEEFYH
jgi:hypothetical protein